MEKLRATSNQRKFVSIYAASGQLGRAANAAGMSGNAALEALELAPVQRALKDALHRRVLELSPRALLVMEKLATDESVPPAVRRLAAADILDRAGLVSQAALALSRPVESLSEMPAQDLRALVDRLETELFARSKPVQALESPDYQVIEPNPLDVLG